MYYLLNKNEIYPLRTIILLQHKIGLIKPPDLYCVHYHCNPCACLKKCCAPNLLNFHIKNTLKVILTS